MDRVTGLGRAIFAALVLMIRGVLSIIYGCGVGGHIGAIDGERANPGAGEERAELQQVNPIRLKGVARGIPRGAAAQSRPRRARVVCPKSPADNFSASKDAHRDGAGLEAAHRKRVNGPIARVFSSTRAGVRSPLGDGGGAEGMSGTSGTAQDEERGRPAPGQSRAQP